MGIRLYAYALSDRTIETIAANPNRFEENLSHVAKRPTGMSISPLVNFLVEFAQRIRPAMSEGANIDIDKAWHGIHYLLSGMAWEGDPPFDFLLNGGTEIVESERNVEHRLYTSRQVLELSRALMPIDAAQLQKRFNPEDMVKLDIYPFIQIGDHITLPNEDDLNYYVHHFTKLKSFISKAARSNFGLVTTRG